MKLTKNHIKYASTSQLAKLLGKKTPAISRWNKSEFVTSSVHPEYDCIERQELIAGLISRKERFEQIESYRNQFDQILANSQKIEKPAIA